eukprot:scpid113588/ scgid27962/ 
MDLLGPNLSNKPRMMKIHQSELKREKNSFGPLRENDIRRVSALERQFAGGKGASTERVNKRETDIQTARETETHRQRDKESHRETHRHRQRDTTTEGDRDGDRNS